MHGLHLPLAFKESVAHTEQSYESTADIERQPLGEAPTSRPLPRQLLFVLQCAGPKPQFCERGCQTPLIEALLLCLEGCFVDLSLVPCRLAFIYRPEYTLPHCPVISHVCNPPSLSAI